MKVIPYSPRWQDRVLALRAQAYGTEAHSHRQEHFRWHFLDHPEGRPPLYLLAVEGETLLGQWAGLPDRLWSRGRAWDCAWMVDLYVAPEHRHSMAAPALFRAAMAEGRPLLAIGASQDILDFFKVFRWDRLAVLDTFYRVFRPGPLLALSGRSRTGGQAQALAIADRLLPLAWRLRGRRGSAEVHRVEHLGPELDTLFQALRPRLGVCSERSAALLAWRFEGRPCGRHQALALRDKGGRLRGYAVVKLRQRPGRARWAELADFLVDPQDDPGFLALAEAASAFALEAGADFLRLRCSLPEHTGLLRTPMWQRHVRAPMDDLFVWTARDAEARAALRAHPWSLTALASDLVDTGLDEWPSPPPRHNVD